MSAKEKLECFKSQCQTLFILMFIDPRFMHYRVTVVSLVIFVCLFVAYHTGRYLPCQRSPRLATALFQIAYPLIPRFSAYHAEKQGRGIGLRSRLPSRSPQVVYCQAYYLVSEPIQKQYLCTQQIRHWHPFQNEIECTYLCMYKMPILLS